MGMLILRWWRMQGRRSTT
uniref:Uncharacterized protein n=1 Tax=Arundo donax TaxID=35708 RepID=A0A0A9BCA4_ARUDO